MTLDTGIMFANGPISGKHANGSLPSCPLSVLDVQSGIFRSGGHGSQEVTGYSVSHFLRKKNIQIQLRVMIKLINIIILILFRI